MKRSLILTFVLSLLIITSCKKEDWGNKDRKHKKGGDKGCMVFYAPDKYDQCDDAVISLYNSDSFIEFEIVPFANNDNCSCPVKGYYKYVSQDMKVTQALIDYGNGECDGYAVLRICADGDCFSKDVSTCTFDAGCMSTHASE